MSVKRKQGVVKIFKANEMKFVKKVIGGKEVEVLEVESKIVSKTSADGIKVEMDLTDVPMAENRLFRKFGNMIKSGDENRFDWRDFAVVSGDEKGTAPLVPEYMLSEGFYYAGQLYKCVIRSASGMRLAKAMFSSIPALWDSIDDVTFGAQFGEVTLMSKRRSYEGLALTNSIEISDMKFTHKLLPDFKRTITTDAVKMIDGKMEEVDAVQLDVEPTDGQGYITYEKAVEIAKALELNYVPSAFQVRYAGTKGLLIVWKWDRLGNGKKWDADVLFHHSMWKYDYDKKRYNERKGNAPRMEVAAYTKPLKTEYANLCYQYINALNITGEDLIGLANKALAKLENGVLKDTTKAMTFLGMVDKIGEDYDENSLTSKLTRTLDANPTMIDDPYVQRKLKGLMEKFVMDMRQGRVPVKGKYRYVIADPTTVFGNPEGVLKAGEYYFNNEVKTYAGFRSPLIDASEPVKMNMIEVPAFSSIKSEYHPDFGTFTYLNDLIVLNTYDDTLPRMGGMDVDGDKILITEEEVIINAVAGGRLIIQSSAKAVKVANTPENLVKFDLKTMVKSRIGIITNYATVWADYMHHKKNPAVRGYIQELQDVQGREIDSVKTGQEVIIMDYLKIPVAPHWMEQNYVKSTVMNRIPKEKPVERQVKQYQSTSPMGQLYTYIYGCPTCRKHHFDAKKFSACKRHESPLLGYWINFSEANVENPEKRTLEILRNGGSKVEQSLIMPYVRRLEHAFRQELAILRDYQEQNSIEDDDDTLNARRTEIFDRYTQLMDSIDADPRAKAAVAYHIAYNERNGRAISFPWITCFDELMVVLAGVGDDRFKLTRMSGKDLKEGVFQFYEGEEVNGLKIYGNVPGYTDIEIVNVEGKFYGKVPRTALPKVEEKAVDEVVQFNLKGFKHQGLTTQEAFDIIAKNDNKIILVESDKYIEAYAGDTQVGVVSREDDFTTFAVMNKEMVITHHGELTYISSKNGKEYFSQNVTVTAKVTGEVEITEEETEESASSESFASKFESFGFEGVRCVLHGEIGEVGYVAVTFKGKEYKYTVNMDYDGEIFFTQKIKSDEIRQTLVEYVVSRMNDEAEAI